MAGRGAPTRQATTWLLSTGWKRLGLLDFDDKPASVGELRTELACRRCMNAHQLA